MTPTYKSGDMIDVQISPFGEFESHDGVKEHEGVVQVVDDEAVDNMVAAFDKELFVDLDHQSYEGGSSEAAAWIVKVWKDPKLGLMGTFRLTAKGADAIGDNRYRYLSPVWYLDKNQKPCKLDSVALTNRPNLPVRPLTNAARSETPLHFVTNALHFSPSVSDGKTDGENSEGQEEPFLNVSDAPSKTTQNERNPAMDKLKELLSLAPEATEEDIIAAVQAIITERDEMKAANADAEAENFAEEHANKGVPKEVLKNAYKTSPGVAKAIVENMELPAAPKAQEPICNSAAAKTPVLKNSSIKGSTPEERTAYIMAHANEL